MEDHIFAFCFFMVRDYDQANTSSKGFTMSNTRPYSTYKGKEDSPYSGRDFIRISSDKSAFEATLEEAGAEWKGSIYLLPENGAEKLMARLNALFVQKQASTIKDRVPESTHTERLEADKTRVPVKKDSVATGETISVNNRQVTITSFSRAWEIPNQEILERIAARFPNEAAGFNVGDTMCFAYFEAPAAETGIETRPETGTSTNDAHTTDAKVGPEPETDTNVNEMPATDTKVEPEPETTGTSANEAPATDVKVEPEPETDTGTNKKPVENIAPGEEIQDDDIDNMPENESYEQDSIPGF